MTDDRVRFTDDQAAWSKASCVKQNYWKDDAILKIVPKGPRRSPLIHAMYFMRYHTINTILDHLLTKFNQFLILGAGTDTSFWRLNIADKPEIKWFEIDFPENLEMKRNLMEKRYGVASNYIPGTIIQLKYMLSSYEKCIHVFKIYYLSKVASDLRKLKEMEQKLMQNNFNFEKPTLVLSEVVLAYLSTKYSTAVINWVSKSIPNSIFVEFEQFQTDTTFSSVMTDHFIRLGSPLKTIFDLPNISDRRDRLEKAGFSNIELFPMMDIELAMMDLEPFDEYEALHAVLKHYYLGMSCSTEENSVFITGIIGKLNIRRREYPVIDYKWKFESKNGESTRRSFHSTILNTNELLVFGGFGSDSDDGSHKKLTSTIKMDQNGSVTVTDNVTFEAVSPVTLNFTNGTILVYGGRKSPYKVNLEYTQLNTDLEIDLPENLIGSYRTAVCSTGPDHFIQFGGRGNPKGKFSSSLYEIMLVDDKITGAELKPIDNKSLPPLASSTVTFMDSKIWVIGGLFENGTISNKIFKLELQSLGYKIVEVITLKFSIYGHTAEVYNNAVVICGGISDISYDDDYIIRITSDNECSIERIRLGEERCLMHGHSMAVRENGIEIIGGGNNCFSFGTHLNPLQTIIKRIQD